MKRRAANGFTLVELVMVIMILGILAGVAAPRLLDVAADSEAVAILTNVNLIFDAAERYAAEHGQLPANAYVGEMPSELVPDYLQGALFTTPTSTGNPLDGDGLGTGSAQYGVNISVGSGLASTSDLYRRLEQIADGGGQDTGWIRALGQKIVFRLADK